MYEKSCTRPVDSAVNPAHLLICSLAWQRSSPAKAVSHKNQPLSQHITTAGISNSAGNRGNHSQCPQYSHTHTHTHTRANHELRLICTQGVFLCLHLFLPCSFHTHILLPCLLPLQHGYPLTVELRALSLISLLLPVSLHHHLTLARLPVLTPLSLPFSCLPRLALFLSPFLLLSVFIMLEEIRTFYF